MRAFSRLAAIGALLATAPAYAQLNVQADTAPGFATGTVVTPAGAARTISGGEKEGGNLFHSFAEFDVAPGTATWTRGAADAATITNIINRVRSGSVSNISGTLSVSDMPNADNYLINPAGISFVDGASIQLPNNAVFSTAQEIRFGSGPTFSTITPDGSTLNDTAPASLGFLGGSGNIQFSGVVTIGNPTASADFVGANVTSTGTINALTGAVTLVAVGNGAETFDLNNPLPVIGNGTVSLASGSNLNARGATLVANSVTLDNAEITTNTATNITIRANQVQLTNGSDLNAAGAVSMETDNLTVSGGSTISTGTLTVDVLAQLGASAINAAIAGTGNLEVSGGTATLTAANTYSGTTSVNMGLLDLTGSGALASTNISISPTGELQTDGGALAAGAGVALAGGGVLDFNGSETFATLTGAGSTTIDGGTLTVGDGTDFTFDGTFGGAGGITKQGAGAFTLTGNSAGFGGPFNVAGGTLVLNSMLGSTVNIGAGGTLAGTGLAAAFLVDGTLAPGAPGAIGTLSATGIGTFAAGSTFQVQVAANGTSDLLDLAGAAMLNGGTVAVETTDPGEAYALGQQFTILTAQGGVTGTFDGVQDTSAFLDFALAYDAMNVFLTTISVADFATVAATPNQAQIAGVLDGANPPPGSDLEMVLNELRTLAADPAQDAFNAMQGEAHAAGAIGAGFAAGQFNGMLQGNGAGSPSGVQSATLGVEGGGYGAAITPAIAPALSVWFGGFGGQAEVDGDGNASGTETQAYGIAGGLEGDLSHLTGMAVRAGLGVGYSSGAVGLDNRLQSADLENLHLGLYAAVGATALEEGFAASGALSYTFSTIETSRTVAFATINRSALAEYDAHTIAGDLDLRYRFRLSDDAAALPGPTFLAPFVKVQAASTYGDSFSETGAGALNLSSAGVDRRDSSIAAGLAISGQYQFASGLSWSPTFSVAYERGLADDVKTAELTIGGLPTPFLVSGPSESRDRLVLGSKSTFAIDENTAFTLAISTLLSEDRRDFAASAGFKIQF